VRREDRVLCFLPMYHSFAQNFIFNGTIRAGATLVILPKFEMDNVLRVMAEEKITRWHAVPTIYILVLGTPGAEEAFRHVNFCFSAAATMPLEVARQWYERFGLKINEGYGLTESTPSAVFNHTVRHKHGTVGTPIMNVEVQIWDPEGRVLPVGEVGEIVIKGPNVMKGYYNDPVATAETLVNGWVRTGDVGVLDEEGYLSLVDRIKDMVNSAGLKIWPREVEEVLYAHEAVEECAVIGVPDPVFGESVKACIVLRSGATLCAEDVIVYCKEQLASYKAPKIVEFMESLPKSPTGKILKTELRKTSGES
jgi:long-chain acyl-CoA synthetase